MNLQMVTGNSMEKHWGSVKTHFFVDMIRV
jgi:hypothetical protein